MADPIQVCDTCGNPLTDEESQLCENTASKYGVDLRYHHMSCFREEVQTQALADPKVRDYIVNQANVCRLTIHPIVGTGKDNENYWYDESIKANHTKSFSEIALLLRGLQGAAAACQFILNNIKTKQNLIDLDDLESDRKLRVKAADQKRLDAIKAKRQREEDNKKILQLSPEEADKFKKDQKQIDFLMTKLGMTKTDALASVEAARLKAEARASKTN